jgi:hypothetical protein
MRHIQTAFIFACLLFFFSCKKDSSDPISNVQLTKGLVAYFPFNGNTNDESGNGNNGSLINGTSLSYDENGRPQSALNLNGSGQKLLVNNNGKIKFDTTMTVSFNVMPRITGRSDLIGMTENTSGKGTSFVIGPSLPGNSNFIYSISNNDVTCDAIQTSTQVTNIDAGVTLQPESWYQIICSYNKGTMKLYINGTLIATQNSKDNTMHTCPNAQLLIGGWWNQDPAASFNGKIDEVRLYNRELNTDEIKELAKSFQ